MRAAQNATRSEAPAPLSLATATGTADQTICYAASETLSAQSAAFNAESVTA